MKNSMYNFINSTFDQTINVQIASPKLKNEKLAKISPDHWKSVLQAKVITKELPFPNSKWKLLQYFPLLHKIKIENIGSTSKRSSYSARWRSSRDTDELFKSSSAICINCAFDGIFSFSISSRVRHNTYIRYLKNAHWTSRLTYTKAQTQVLESN